MHVVEARLRSYTPTRALVFGQYAEASQDVHTLLEYLARHRATAQWRRYGARSAEEAYGFFIAALRRRVGVFAAREMARHRLRRIPFVGVPRAAVVAYTGRPQQVVQDRAQIAALTISTPSRSTRPWGAPSVAELPACGGERGRALALAPGRL